MRYFSCDKFQAASWTFMIKQYSRTCKNVIALSIIDSNEVSIHFCNTIRASRIKRSFLCLRSLKNFSKHFRGRCLIKLDFRVVKSDCFKNSGHTKPSDICSKEWLIPGGWNKRLGTKVIHFIRIYFFDKKVKGVLISKISLHKLHILSDVINIVKFLNAGAANKAIHFIAFG